MSNREKRWTPGPWFACHPKDLGMTVAKLDNTWVVKCDEPLGPGEYDAHLIKAAPLLVEALEQAVEAWKNEYGSCPPWWEDALAKAYGEK